MKCQHELSVGSVPPLHGATTLLEIPRRKNGDSLATMGAKVSPFILGSQFFGIHRNYIQAFTVIFTGFHRYFYGLSPLLAKDN